MIKRLALLFLFSSIVQYATAQSSDSAVIKSIYSEELARGKSYEMLEYLSKEIGHRLSGSEGAALAVEWTKKKMEEFGFDRVYLQEVMVPHWVRGKKESAKIVGKQRVPICDLGGSIGTGSKGIRAMVVEVHSYEELEKLGSEKVDGKIVFYNRPMDPTEIMTFRAYGGAVSQRWSGAMEAAKYGAVGVVVRSMTLALDDYPHTGSMGYNDEIKKIPACAISTNGAEILSECLKSEPAIEFQFKMYCETLEDVLSYNVIGEIIGTEFPDEIILVGGHLDSWDMGDGSHDDGAGCIQSIEAVRLFIALDIKPKRTIRAVMFMNEENGLRGGKEYARVAKEKNENHIAAIETDAGAFTPRGFGIDADEESIAKIVAWKSLFEPYNLHLIGKGHGGADIGPLKDQGAVLISLRVDSQRYFDYHHSDADTFDKISKRELEMGTASIASLLYLLSKYGI